MSRLKKGRENIPDGGYIVAGNHHSYFDPLFVALAIRRRIRFMGKSDFFNKGSGFWLSLLVVFRSDEESGTLMLLRRLKQLSTRNGLWLFSLRAVFLCPVNTRSRSRVSVI